MAKIGAQRGGERDCSRSSHCAGGRKQSMQRVLKKEWSCARQQSSQSSETWISGMGAQKTPAHGVIRPVNALVDLIFASRLNPGSRRRKRLSSAFLLFPFRPPRPRCSVSPLLALPPQSPRPLPLCDPWRASPPPHAAAQLSSHEPSPQQPRPCADSPHASSRHGQNTQRLRGAHSRAERANDELTRIDCVVCCFSSALAVTRPLHGMQQRRGFASCTTNNTLTQRHSSERGLPIRCARFEPLRTRLTRRCRCRCAVLAPCLSPLCLLPVLSPRSSRVDHARLVTDHGEG